MKVATLTNAIVRGKSVSGTYQLIREYKEESWAGKPRDGKVIVILGGKETGVWVNRKDVKVGKGSADQLTVEEPKMKATAKAARGPVHAHVPTIEVADVRTDAEIGDEIDQRFSAMNRLTDGVIAGMVKSVIIAGAPGVGKSFELEAKLEKAEAKGKIDYVRVSGAISGIGLYKTLYNYRNKNNVVVLDDVDRIFGDEDALNVLKAGLDTGKKRNITWMTESRALKDEDIPTSFEFCGSIVFITNMNFDRVISSGSKIAPHINALMSRTVYLDLGIHSNREIMVRIEQVVKKGDIFEDKDVNLTKGQKEEVIGWIRANHKRMRRVSLREVLHLGDMVAVDPKGWKQLAEITMFAPKRHF